jgi:hypothetical protein
VVQRERERGREREREREQSGPLTQVPLEKADKREHESVFSCISCEQRMSSWERRHQVA